MGIRIIQDEYGPYDSVDTPALPVSPSDAMVSFDMFGHHVRGAKLYIDGKEYYCDAICDITVMLNIEGNVGDGVKHLYFTFRENAVKESDSTNAGDEVDNPKHYIGVVRHLR